MNIVILKPTVNIFSGRFFFQCIELLVEFIKKDLKAKYRNLFLGIFWVILQPLLLAIFFSLIRTGIQTHKRFIVYDYSGIYLTLIVWTFFVSAFQRSVGSIISNYALVSKINFPTILLPIATVCSSFVDVFVNLGFCVCISVVVSGKITFNIFHFVYILLISSIFIFAICIFISLLQCLVLEISHVVPYCTQLGLFIVPILHNESFIPIKFKFFYDHIPFVWMVSQTKKLFSYEVNPFFSSLDIRIIVINLVFLMFVYIFYRKIRGVIMDYL